MIKKGQKFQHNTDKIEILEREGDLILAKMDNQSGIVSYDISRPFVDSSGYESFFPSPNHNGMRGEDVPGGVRTPFPLEVMEARFREMIDTQKRVKANNKATTDSIEARFESKAIRGQLVKAYRDQARAELTELVNSGTLSIPELMTNKTAKALAGQITYCEQILNSIK